MGHNPSTALSVLPACSKGSTCFTQTPLGTTTIASILRQEQKVVCICAQCLLCHWKQAASRMGTQGMSGSSKTVGTASPLRQNETQALHVNSTGKS